VLRGYGILYLVAAVSFIPMDRILAPQIEDAWEIVPGVIFELMTVTSIGLLEAVSVLAGPLARGISVRQMYAQESVLAFICVAVAAVCAFALVRKNLAPGRQGLYTFLLLLALTIIVMVPFTIHAWAHFA
jgi:hypothetical protein